MRGALLRTRIQEPIIASLDRLERDIKKYQDQSADSVPDRVRVVIVVGGMDNACIAEHLELNAARFKTYGDIRQELALITSTQRR